MVLSQGSYAQDASAEGVEGKEAPRAADADATAADADADATAADAAAGSTAGEQASDPGPGNEGQAEGQAEGDDGAGGSGAAGEQDEFRLDFSDAESAQAIDISTLSFFDVLRILFILGLIIAITYGIIWLLKKIQSKSLINSQSIELLSTQSLHQGNMLYVVKAGETYLLLGSAGQSVSVLKEFSKKEERDELLLALSIGETGGEKGQKRNFFGLLRSLLRPGAYRASGGQPTAAQRREQQKKPGAIDAALSTLSSRVKKSEELNGKS